MVPNLGLWAVELQERLVFVVIGMGLDPTRSDLLNRRTVGELRSLENGERVLIGLLPHISKPNPVHEYVQELIIVLGVHRLEQSVHRRFNSTHGRVRNPLLEIIGAGEPRLRQDC